MSDRHIKRFFEMAKRASEFGEHRRNKLGCVITYKNRVISVGWNLQKENPMQKEYNKCRGFDVDRYSNYIHAEIKALISIRDIDIDWSKVSVFTYREYRNGEMAMSRPCPACMRAILDMGIKNVYYTCKGKFVHEMIQ